ncbi:MAG TPA: isoprenylcysteine carboxylmethyltransferase family protein [Gemmatimonadaceae bacterium]|nr:isoprenylcysteine carboxylmethyltransferase family protein [Gemmatimonadaceae bacterium]
MLRLLLRIPVPWVFVVGYLAGVVVERALRPHVAFTALPGVALAVGVVFLVGAVIAGWGLATFRRARTTTVPGETSARLVTWGPYRATRNPMYVGLILAYLGEAGLLRQVWPLAFLLVVVAYVNWVVIPLEETKLAEAFGGEYTRYRARVRRWL